MPREVHSIIVHRPRMLIDVQQWMFCDDFAVSSSFCSLSSPPFSSLSPLLLSSLLYPFSQNIYLAGQVHPRFLHDFPTPSSKLLTQHRHQRTNNNNGQLSPLFQVLILVFSRCHPFYHVLRILEPGKGFPFSSSSLLSC